MSPFVAWSIFIIGFVLPALHIAVTRTTGPWTAPRESGCPFGPRTGWLILVLMLGPIGWLMFVTRRKPRPPKN